MKTTVLLTLLLGTLTFSACGKAPASGSAGAFSAVGDTQPDQPYLTLLTLDEQQQLRQDIVEAQQVRDDLRAGKVAAPLNDDGTPIDFDAFIRDMQDELQRGKRVLTPAPNVLSGEGLSAQEAPYLQRTYINIAADDNFVGNYNSNQRRFPRFVWSNDGCSGPANYTGWSDEFFWSCVQHDFGYRQIKARFYPGLTNENHRDWVDGQFLQHMRRKCDTLGWRKWPCWAAAQGFWGAVRNGGKDSFYP